MTENPFEPGASVLDNATFRAGAGTFEQPATAVIYALYANAAIDGIQIPMSFVLGYEDESALLLWGGVGVLQLALFIGCVVLWCMWKMRAARNIRVFNDHPYEFTPGWAVGWYFVPFLNLVRPYQAMKEILLWSRSNDGQLVADTSVVSGWWGAWIASNLLANFSSRIESPIATTLASAAGVIAAILAVRVVNAVNESQLEAARMMPVR
jgi:hypothetical protein